MFNAWTWDRRAVWRGVALAAALTASARAGAEIDSLAVVTVPGITLPPTTSTVTLPVTTSTAASTTLPLPLTTTTVTLPLPTTTLGRVSTTSLTLPPTTSTIVVPPTTTTLLLPLTSTTVTLPPLPTTTLGRVSTTSLTLPLTTSTIVVPLPTTTLPLPLTTTTVTLPLLPTSTTLPQALCVGSCDDGFSCTDDVCTAGGCQHVPIDSRCVPPDACTAAVCAPALPGHGAAGCIAGAPRAKGEACAQDGDACTTDVCRRGTCAHES